MLRKTFIIFLLLIVSGLLFIACGSALKTQGNTFASAGIKNSDANGKVFTVTFEFEKANTDYHNKAYVIVTDKNGKKGHFYYANKFAGAVAKMKKDQLVIIKFKVKEAAGIAIGQVDGTLLGMQPVEEKKQ